MEVLQGVREKMSGKKYLKGELEPINIMNDMKTGQKLSDHSVENKSAQEAPFETLSLHFLFVMLYT